MPTSPTSYHADLSAIGASAIEEMTSRSRAREEALSISRQVIRFSANAIRAVHRGEVEEAQNLVHQAGERLEETKAMRHESPQIYYAGFLADARKEYSEASITLAVISVKAIPKPEDLEVDPSSFLNGLAEVIGELRRYILDALRREEFNRCQELMDLMDEIYGVLVTVDFPEAVTGGLRRNTDAMRGVLERTRGDLTMALRQQRLESRLAQWEEGRGGGS